MSDAAILAIELLPEPAWVALGDSQPVGNAAWRALMPSDTWLDAIHPGDRERITGEMHVAAAAARPFDGRARLRAGAAWRWHRLREAASPAMANARIGLAIDAHDEIETPAERRRRTLLDGSSAAHFVLDLKGAILLANETMAAMFGYPSPEGLIGVVLADLLTPEDAIRLVPMVAAFAIDGPPPSAVSGDLVIGRRRDDVEVTLGLALWATETADGREIAGRLDDVARHVSADRTNWRAEVLRRHFDMDGDYFVSEVDWKHEQVRLGDGLAGRLGLEPDAAGFVTLAALTERVHPDDRWSFLDTLRKTATTSEPSSLIYRLVPLGGVAPLWVEAHRYCQGPASGAHIVSIARDITRLKKLEDGIAANELRTRLAIEGTGAGSWDTDLSTGEAIWSASQFTLLGYDVPEDRKANVSLWRDLVHPDDSDRVWQTVKTTLDSDGAYDVTYRLIRKDGVERWMQSIGRWQRFPGGAPHSIGIIRDVTDATRTLTALAEAEAQSRLALDAGGFGTFRMDPERRITVWSDTTFGHFGVQPSEDRSQPLADVIARFHPDDRAATAAIIQKAIEEGTSFHTTPRVVRPDGSVRQLDAYAQPVTLPDGRRQFVGLVADRTDEIARRDALATSEQRLRLALGAGGFATFEHDVERNESFWSDEMFALFGTPPTPGNIVTRAQADSLVHPEDRPHVRREVERALACGEEFVLRFRVWRDDGATRWVESRARPVLSPDGRRRLVGVAADRTADIEARNSLAASEERSRLALASGGFATFERDMERRESIWSDEMFAMFGIPPTPGHVVPTGLAESRVHPDDIAPSHATMARARIAGEDMVTHYRIVRDDGTMRWIESRARLVALPDGRQRLVGVAADRTDDTEARNALMESEERSRLALWAGEIASWEFDLVSRKATFSPQAFALFGIEPTPDHRIPIESARHFYHPDDTARAMEAFARAITERTELDVQLRIIRPNGNVRWIESRGRMITLADGTDRFIGVTTDRTREVEARLALAASEARSRLALQAGGMATWEFDPEANENLWSPEMFALFGIAPTADGKLPRETAATVIHPEDLPRVRARFDTAADRPGEDWAVEYRLVRPDGAVRWVESRARAVTLDDGRRRVFGLTADRTEEIEARRALTEAQELAQLTMRSAGIGLWSGYADGEGIRWTDTVYDILGYDRTKIERPGPELTIQRVHPDDRDWAVAAWERAQRNGETFNVRVRILHPGRGLRWMELFARIFPPEGGRQFYIGIVRDITAEHTAQQAIAQAEERLRLALDATDDGIWEWRADGNTRWRSDRWYQLYGYESGDPEAHKGYWLDWMHPDDRARAERAEADMLARRTMSFEQELRFRHRLGHWVWVLDRAQVVEWGPDGSARRVMGIHQNISRRKAAEEALATSQAHLKAILDLVPAGVIIISPEGTILGANPAAARLVDGKADAAIIGVDFVEAIEARARAAWQADHRHVCSGETVDWTVRLIRGVEITGRGVPMRNSDGCPVQLAVVQDITAQRAAQRQLGAIQGLLMQESRMAAMAALAAGIAHRFNQPLSAAAANLGAVTALSRAPDAAQPEQAERIRGLVERAGRQVNHAGELLRALRTRLADSGGEMSTYSVRDVVTDVMARLSAETGRAARVHVDVAPDTGDLFGDRELLLKALLPLVRKVKRSILGAGGTELPMAVRRNEEGGAVEFLLGCSCDGACFAQENDDSTLSDDRDVYFFSSDPDAEELESRVARVIVAGLSGSVRSSRNPGIGSQCLLISVPDFGRLLPEPDAAA